MILEIYIIQYSKINILLLLIKDNALDKILLEYYYNII